MNPSDSLVLQALAASALAPRDEAAGSSVAGTSAGRMLLPTTAYEFPSMPAVRPSRLLCFRGQALAACSAVLLLCLSPAWAANNNRRTAIVVAVEEAKQSVVNIHGRKSV